MPCEFRLPYFVENGGDGSAIVRPCSTLEEAEQRDEEQPQGWGESSAGNLYLKVDGCKLYFRAYVDGRGFQWIEVK